MHPTLIDVIAFFLVCICYLIASSIPNFLEHIIERKKKLKSKKPVADGGKAGSRYKRQVHVAIIILIIILQKDKIN